ncbi:FAD-dependent oxidoreductase [Gymnodinialimonas phycosphaerae]|uniref:FAD-dependent oxidoreductase n=1 Tax=Gymnodinialimonas phycosphaerae TaxID=2841589 RepID=UPI002150A4F0|nr:FAD-binding oxidoreductase [Gymnodinialimonas phycosphaerae]
MKMTLGIAGAGIGGLAAAALLARDGHEVVVFDRFAAPRPVGSGLVIQPVGMDVLDACGAAAEVAARGAPIQHMFGDEADSGKTVLSVAYGKTPDRQGLGIHRAALFNALFQAAKGAGARIVASSPVTGRDGQYLVVNGKREGPFDLIVDALGANSALSPPACARTVLRGGLGHRPLAEGRAVCAGSPDPTLSQSQPDARHPAGRHHG